VVDKRFVINPTKGFSVALVPMADRARAAAANADPRAAKAKTCVELWHSGDALRDQLLDELSLAADALAQADGEAAKAAAAAWKKWLTEYVRRFVGVLQSHGNKAMEWHARVMQHCHLNADGDLAVTAAMEWLSSQAKQSDSYSGRGRGGRGRGRGGRGGNSNSNSNSRSEDFPKDRDGKPKCRLIAKGLPCPNGDKCKYSHKD
jgi:hypothetical protein